MNFEVHIWIKDRALWFMVFSFSQKYGRQWDAAPVSHSVKMEPIGSSEVLPPYCFCQFPCLIAHLIRTACLLVLVVTSFVQSHCDGSVRNLWWNIACLKRTLIVFILGDDNYAEPLITDCLSWKKHCLCLQFRDDSAQNLCWKMACYVLKGLCWYLMPQSSHSQQGQLNIIPLHAALFRHLLVSLFQELFAFGCWHECRIERSGSWLCHWNSRRCRSTRHSSAAQVIRRHDPHSYLRWGVGIVWTYRRPYPLGQIGCCVCPHQRCRGYVPIKWSVDLSAMWRWNSNRKQPVSNEHLE